jgi:hypothetical protein
LTEYRRLPCTGRAGDDEPSHVLVHSSSLTARELSARLTTMSVISDGTTSDAPSRARQGRQ